MNCIAIIVSMPVLASALPLLCKKLQRSVVKRLQCQWPLFKLLTLPDICFYLFFSSLLSLSLFFPPLHPPSDTSTFYFLSFVFFAAPSLSLSFSSLHPHSDTAASVISSQNFCLLFLISACLVLSSPLHYFLLFFSPVTSPTLSPPPPLSSSIHPLLGDGLVGADTAAAGWGTASDAVSIWPALPHRGSPLLGPVDRGPAMVSNREGGSGDWDGVLSVWEICPSSLSWNFNSPFFRPEKKSWIALAQISK